MPLTATGQVFRPNRATLINVGGVRALTGWSYDSIFARVDGSDLIDHELAWVFNFATNPAGQKRELRFWRYELEQYEEVSCLKIEAVIDRILPRTRSNFHAGEVVEIFTLTRPALKDLRAAMGGELVAAAHTSFFPRQSLVAFLNARWLRAVYTRRVKSSHEK